MRDLLQRPDLFSINTATLGYKTPLPAIIDACVARGIGAIAPWRRELQGEDLQQIARQLAASNMSVSGLCRSTYYTAPTLAERKLAIDDNRRALDWCDELDPDGEFGLGVAVDVYHVWWDPDLASQILRAGKRILAFHVSDWLVPTTDLVNDRGMPGDGVINIPSIRRLVENAGFNGAIELEIFSPYWWQKDINSTLDISVDRIAHYC
ncbi:sugar phosphate isomerase/epimerase [Shigella boydii]|uniref:sugar phosphate isomerase/epimerase family protein n=1 Tax=Shigella boydii TaxID=621 RepID=UPI002878D64F|nr:sugar phosphate isomerase/epimerase [Shigella boydii]MDS1443566.1 sugar phosphate isomerase/epimerase [Shigella boydii]MDS1448880.1 sugar phosphate isomerase/epimerase [Shigella boydii]MDS1482850.1 sugar phosphate isomerase/epimerase [Shigella boydii]MDS1485384.1 sugar phosphate isomerase/epimerase [Shigella boydii]